MKQLIAGIEIIGRVKDSGYKIPLYLIRTPEGKFIHLTELLFHTVVALQNETTLQAVAAKVSVAIGKEVDDEAIAYLINEKLEPLGIVANSAPKKEKSEDQLLGLIGRSTLIPEAMVNRIANLLRPFFYQFIIGAVLTAVLEINIWLYFWHGISNALQQTALQPIVIVLAIVLTLLSSLFHELGHATACLYGGGRPKRIGAGLYLFWPAFFTDITDAYRLNRVARIRSDIGGIYFNLIFSLGIAAVYFFTRFEPLLLLIAIQNIEILYQLMPFLRLDGYFIISDIVGVPNLFGRIKPILFSILPGQKQEGTRDLKPWVRWIVTLWVTLTVPFIIYFFWTSFSTAPQFFTTAWNSAIVQIAFIGKSFGEGNYLMTVFRGLQLFILLFSAAGFLIIIFRFGTKGLSLLYQLAGDSISKKVIITVGIFIEALVIFTKVR